MADDKLPDESMCTSFARLVSAIQHAEETGALDNIEFLAEALEIYQTNFEYNHSFMRKGPAYMLKARELLRLWAEKKYSEDSNDVAKVNTKVVN
jgi:hypothetical protein